MIQELHNINWKNLVKTHQTSYDYEALRPIIDEMRIGPRDPHFVTNFIERTGNVFPERTVRRWFMKARSDPSWYPNYDGHKYHRRALGDVNEELIGNEIDEMIS